MIEKELSVIIGDIIRKHRRDESGKTLSRKAIADQLGFTQGYITQVERGVKISLYQFFRILTCLPPAEARGALLDVLQAFGLAGIIESAEASPTDLDKLERIRALLNE